MQVAFDDKESDHDEILGFLLRQAEENSRSASTGLPSKAQKNDTDTKELTASEYPKSFSQESFLGGTFDHNLVNLSKENDGKLVSSNNASIVSTDVASAHDSGVSQSQAFENILKVIKQVQSQQQLFQSKLSEKKSRVSAFSQQRKKIFEIRSQLEPLEAPKRIKSTRSSSRRKQRLRNIEDQKTSVKNKSQLFGNKISGKSNSSNEKYKVSGSLVGNNNLVKSSTVKPMPNSSRETVSQDKSRSQSIGHETLTDDIFFSLPLPDSQKNELNSQSNVRTTKYSSRQNTDEQGVDILDDAIEESDSLFEPMPCKKIRALPGRKNNGQLSQSSLTLSQKLNQISQTHFRPRIHQVSCSAPSTSKFERVKVDSVPSQRTMAISQQKESFFVVQVAKSTRLGDGITEIFGRVHKSCNPIVRSKSLLFVHTRLGKHNVRKNSLLRFDGEIILRNSAGGKGKAFYSHNGLAKLLLF